MGPSHGHYHKRYNAIRDLPRDAQTAIIGPGDDGGSFRDNMLLLDLSTAEVETSTVFYGLILAGRMPVMPKPCSKSSALMSSRGPQGASTVESVREGSARVPAQLIRRKPILRVGDVDGAPRGIRRSETASWSSRRRRSSCARQVTFFRLKGVRVKKRIPCAVLRRCETGYPQVLVGVGILRLRERWIGVITLNGGI